MRGKRAKLLRKITAINFNRAQLYKLDIPFKTLFRAVKKTYLTAKRDGKRV